MHESCSLDEDFTQMRSQIEIALPSIGFHRAELSAGARTPADRSAVRAHALAVGSRRRRINHGLTCLADRLDRTGVVSSAGDNRCDNLISAGRSRLEDLQDGTSALRRQSRMGHCDVAGNSFGISLACCFWDGSERLAQCFPTFFDLLPTVTHRRWVGR